MNTENSAPIASAVPELEPWCGSWVIVSRATGKPVFETYERRTAEAVNQSAYEVLTAYKWLVRFNAAVTQADETAKLDRWFAKNRP